MELRYEKIYKYIETKYGKEYLGIVKNKYVKTV